MLPDSKAVAVQGELGAVTIWRAPGIHGPVARTVGGTVGVQNVGSAWTPRVVTSVLVTLRGAPPVERVERTVGCTARVFIPKGGAVRRTVCAQWVFTAWTSWVLSRKKVTVSGTKDVERVH